MAITPDGPRGPAQVMAEGLPADGAADRRAGAVRRHGAASPAIRLDSWDRDVLPLPVRPRRHGLGQRPVYPAKATTWQDLARPGRDRLTAVEARADALAGLERLRPSPLRALSPATRPLEPLAPRPAATRARKRGKEDPARRRRTPRRHRPRPARRRRWSGCTASASARACRCCRWSSAFATARPDLTVLVTSGTVTSADLLARRLPPGVIHQYAPGRRARRRARASSTTGGRTWPCSSRASCGRT